MNFSLTSKRSDLAVPTKKYHLKTIPHVRLLNQELGEAVFRLSPTEQKEFFRGVLFGLEEEWSGDIRRGYVKLAALEDRAIVLTGRILAQYRNFPKSETTIPRYKIPYLRLSPHELGRAVVHLRYDCALQVFQGVWIGAIHLRGSKHRGSLHKIAQEMQKLVRIVRQMLVLCRPYMEHEFERDHGGALQGTLDDFCL